MLHNLGGMAMQWVALLSHKSPIWLQAQVTVCVEFLNMFLLFKNIPADVLAKLNCA